MVHRTARAHLLGLDPHILSDFGPLGDFGVDETAKLLRRAARSPADAAARIAELAPYQPYWIEEPIGTDQPHAAWRGLAQASAAPPAAGLKWTPTLTRCGSRCFR